MTESEQQLRERVKELETALQGRKKRDYPTYSSVAVAATGVLMTGLLGYGQWQIASNQNRMEASSQVHERVRDMNTNRLDQARVFAQYVEWITGSDRVRQLYAIRTVRVFLPDLAEQLLQSVGPELDRESAAAVMEELDEVVETAPDSAAMPDYFEDLWSTTRATRLSAFRRLLASHTDNPAVLGRLCREGAERVSLRNYDSAWNMLRLIEEAELSAIAPHIESCREFTRAVEERVRPGRRGRTLLRRVRRQLGREPPLAEVGDADSSQTHEPPHSNE